MHLQEINNIFDRLPSDQIERYLAAIQGDIKQLKEMRRSKSGARENSELNSLLTSKRALYNRIFQIYRQRQQEWKVEALIIAEITGSITYRERYKLNAWRKQCQGVQNMSAEFHEVLDPVMADLMETKITAKQIIRTGNVQLRKESKMLNK